jgi:hypothetical protein
MTSIIEDVPRADSPARQPRCESLAATAMAVERLPLDQMTGWTNNHLHSAEHAGTEYRCEHHACPNDQSKVLCNTSFYCAPCTHPQRKSSTPGCPSLPAQLQPIVTVTADSTRLRYRCFKLPNCGWTPRMLCGWSDDAATAATVAAAQPCNHACLALAAEHVPLFAHRTAQHTIRTVRAAMAQRGGACRGDTCTCAQHTQRWWRALMRECENIRAQAST